MLRCRKPTPPGLLEWCSPSEQDLQGPQGLPLTLGDVCLWLHAHLPLSDTEPAEPRTRDQKCVKCKEGLPVVVIRAGDAFCRDCFKALYVHKFRAMLGKNRLIFPGEKVLLAWSGGPSSSSMVWQVLEGLSRDSAKRLRFVPGVIYVDEGAACSQSPEDRAKSLAEVKLVLQTTGFPWHIVALEEVFSLPPSVLRCSAQEPVGTEGAYKAAVDSFLQQQHALGADGVERQSQHCTQDPHSPTGPPTTAQTQALSRLFDSVKTLTAKEELLQTLRTHLILHVARNHGYSKVMTGDSCTRLAIKLMTSLALGRGAFLAWDTGFSDERHGDVVVVRPMREHTLKEVAFYNHLFAVPSVCTPALDTKAPEKASIHRLMEAFILRLQAQFPSTVSTVYRTSEKLVKAPRDGCVAGPHCLLCMCTLDVDTAGPSSPCAVLGPGTRECSWGFVAPEVPSAPLCLQIAPRLLGLRPHISPRCSPLSRRPGWLLGPAAVLEWAGPPAAAGGESLSRPVMPPTPLWSAPWGCTVWVRPGVLTEGRARRSVQHALQGGPPGPGHGAAVLQLPSEHEGLALLGALATLHPV
ncbi:cytoplasmic tRNA 2-thiolation protein 2 isoform X1 [Oryx dammah]|uniref:cytoplasmic tRNA 2-thiolation protein 2 isoform X1 n=2 Tax=Oryx dammah TaxID=59534 RepID=UPI001A9B0543|nr:cytoplasmic tRNA 2-thiolation protein 2 isoform X1 [Oryx dammah]